MNRTNYLFSSFFNLITPFPYLQPENFFLVKNSSDFMKIMVMNENVYIWSGRDIGTFNRREETYEY